MRRRFNINVINVDQSLESNPTYFWQFMKHKRGNHIIPDEMTFDNKSLIGGNEIIEGVAKFFCFSGKFVKPYSGWK